MDETIDTLASFTAAKDSRLACAAAVVLAELQPREPAVVQQLVAGLENADPVRRPFIIEALGRIGTAEAAAALVPLIKAEGPTSEMALRAIAHTESAALKPLLKLVGNVSPALLERIAECAARTGETAAFAGLCAGLANATVETCRAIRGGLRAALASFSAQAKERLHKQLEQSFADEKLAGHQPSLIALMKIAGDLGDAGAQQALFRYTSDSQPPHVRREALQALGALHLPAEQRGKWAGRLLPCLFEHDLVNVAEPALEALRHAQLGSEHQAQLRKLLQSPSPRVREFAMQALAAQGTPRTIQELISCLDSPDRSVRQDALGALSHAPAAAGALCERLLESDGGEPAAEIARALEAQAAKLPPKLLSALADQYVSLATGGGATSKIPAGQDAARKAEEKRRAILGVFRASASTVLVEAVCAKARKLRLNDEALRAYELMKGVAGLNGWTDEYRLEFAFAGLAFGPTDLARSARNVDQNLRILEEALTGGAKEPEELARVILKDAALSRKVLYFLGFHFIERLREQRRLGQLILEHLAESRTEEGRQAKEKLALEGLANLRGAKAGILEERAKVLAAAATMAAVDRAREEKKEEAEKKSRPAKAKPALAGKKGAKKR
ncbi:MAG: HEAT repeat domain-containing protein [Planctomycetota bacterium]